jgi:predicted HicB family RNase H-like nuclease
MVHIRLDPDLHRRLRVVVAAEDTSVQDWVARVIGKAVVENWPDIDKRDTE